jgi:hypothetical protein
MSDVILCTRCDRATGSLDGWNFTLAEGVAVGHVCPHCQTEEENAETEIHAAAVDFEDDELQRILGRPRDESPVPTHATRAAERAEVRKMLDILTVSHGPGVDVGVIRLARHNLVLALAPLIGLPEFTDLHAEAHRSLDELAEIYQAADLRL